MDSKSRHILLIFIILPALAIAWTGLREGTLSGNSTAGPDKAWAGQMADGFQTKPFQAVLKKEWVPGEFIVRFSPGVSRDVIDRTNRNHGASVLSISSRGKFMRLRVPAGQSVKGMVEAYSRNPNVEYAEPNYIAYALGVPNDPLYSYQWHLDNPVYGGIHMEAAWDVQTGSPGVIVAVVDTGVAYENYGAYMQAPDLAGTSFVQGYDFANNDAHPNDDHGHGTHLTGTITQSTNNGLGVAGVAYGTSIMPVKVLTEAGSGTIADIADGIYYAADNGADVINMSFGSILPSATMEDAVNYAHSVKGVTLVCAAGNYGQSFNLPSYPAAYENCIAVGATRYDETRSYYSNTGAYVDLVAPGGDTTVDQNNDGYGDGVLQQTFNSDPAVFGYWFWQGTSMAAPHVSGVAALLIAQGVTGPDNVREALQNTAEDKGPAGWDSTYGWGLVDAYAALNYSPGPPTPVHDVAVTDMAALSWAFRGDTVPVVVSVSNQGTESESFTVTLTDITDSQQTGQQPVTLAAGASQDLLFTWDTTAASLGTHVLEAEASTVPGETDTADNAMSTAITIQEPVHDVAVIALDAPAGATVGDTLNVQVTVENQGTYPEATMVSLTDTYDGAPIGSPQAAALNPGDSATFDFTWPTSGEAPGSHTLLAQTSAVAGETDIADNSMTTVTEITEVPAGPAMSVSDISVDLQSKGPRYQARATIIVSDDSNELVRDATVSAQWVLTDADSNVKYFAEVSGTTNRKGKVSLNSDTLPAASGDTFTITVIDVTKSGYTYVPGPATSGSAVVP